MLCKSMLCTLAMNQHFHTRLCMQASLMNIINLICLTAPWGVGLNVLDQHPPNRSPVCMQKLYFQCMGQPTTDSKNGSSAPPFQNSWLLPCTTPGYGPTLSLAHLLERLRCQCMICSQINSATTLGHLCMV